MLLMFIVFSAMFFMDASTGYREKNRVYFLSKTFEAAIQELGNHQDRYTPESWKAYASKQIVQYPTDASVLPAGLQLPEKWPAVLLDYDKVKAANLKQREFFSDYTASIGIMKDVPEHPYDAGKIREQWIVGGIFSVLSVLAVVVLIRTLGRSMAVDNEAFYPVEGGRVPFAQLVRLDLRKWQTKGLAFAWSRTESGKEKRHRIDGLTYGGFKKEQGEPAEALMQRIRENFSGEITEYLSDEETPEAPQAPEV
jgi:hypothetical protein